MSEVLLVSGLVVLMGMGLYVTVRMAWEMLCDGFVPAYVLLLGTVLAIVGAILQS